MIHRIWPQGTRNQHRTWRLAQDSIHIRTKQRAHPKAGSVRAHADQVDLILLGIIQDLSIRMTFTNRRFYVTPKIHFRRHNSLQSTRRSVIGRLTSNRLPGDLRLTH